MADNVAITAGAGTNIATDEVTGTLEHVQLMKIAISTDGSRTLVPADATNGIDVDVTRVSGQVTVGDGTNAVAVVTAPADGASNTLNRLRAESAMQVFNGTTWDRARGDTTNGLDVDVTRVQGTVTVATHDVGSITTAVTPGTGATNLGKAEDAAHTTGDVGVMALGVRAAAPTERSAGPTDGDYEPFATNEVGAVWVTHTHSANGGASTINSTSSDGGTALTNTAQAIKASAGTLVGYYIYNPNNSVAYVQFYNTASGSVVIGTTAPLFMLTIPAASAANLWMPGGVTFGTAMSWSACSTAAAGGALTTACDAVCWYK